MLVLAMALVLGFIGYAGAADRGIRAAGEVQVLSGGVGAGAREELAQQARGYNLKLVFTLSSGNFIADVPFHVVRNGQIIVDTVAQGPWAFVKLAPGNYTIKAAYEGRSLTKQASVPASGQKRVAFTWPAPARVKQQPN